MSESNVEPVAEPVVPAGTEGENPLGTEAASVLRQNWGWFAAAAAGLVLLYFLGPILAPFLISAGLAYLGDPLVDRLELLGLSRTLGVCIVFVVFFGVVVTALILVVPMLEEQIITFAQNIPDWLKWVQDVGLPKIGVHLPAGIRLDAGGLRDAVTHNLSQAGDIAGTVLDRVKQSTPVLLEFIANALLIPIVSFYLLRDWDLLVARIDQLIPPRLRPHAEALARETDGVLSALIRGQLLVMAALAAIYSIGLTMAGLKVALLIGIGAGLVSFIPYLGFISGLLAASIAMLVQTQEVTPLLWVAIVFGIGQVLESGVLTPMLVGDRIGLHPVAVIFAILAGGQLFGFVGVLVALPVAAVLAVLLRHARQHWLRSPLYVGAAVQPAKPEAPPAP
ncbi:AI-2E family transporter [Nevskia soli]|uniref:AI-2E family transporter n=1 Tax=Nevskia soli TaxID=418856 RepID=UPI000A03B1E3|nr:AI-2E family transporter [Nevskia soli]